MLSGPDPNRNPDTATMSAASATSTIAAMIKAARTILPYPPASGTEPGRSGRGVGLHRHALVLERLLQFAGLEHLAHDVAAADELALHIELRNGRPVGIGLDAVPQVGGIQHVEAFVGDAQVVEDLHHLPGKPALRKLRRALHEQHHVVSLHFIDDELLDAHGFFSRWAALRPPCLQMADICSADSSATPSGLKMAGKSGL